MKLVALFDVTSVSPYRDSEHHERDYDVINGVLAEAPDEEGVEELVLHSHPQIGFEVRHPDLVGKLRAGSQMRVTFEVESLEVVKKAGVEEKVEKKSSWMVHR